MDGAIRNVSIAANVLNLDRRDIRLRYVVQQCQSEIRHTPVFPVLEQPQFNYCVHICYLETCVVWFLTIKLFAVAHALELKHSRSCGFETKQDYLS